MSRFFKKTGMQAVSRSLFRGGIPEEGAEIVQISAPKSWVSVLQTQLPYEIAGAMARIQLIDNDF